MSSEQMIERFRLLSVTQQNNMKIISKDLNLASVFIQPSMLEWVENTSNPVMIFDRLSSLAYSSPNETVEKFHEWIVEMKEAGVTMIWVHQGKSGKLRPSLRSCRHRATAFYC